MSNKTMPEKIWVLPAVNSIEDIRMSEAYEEVLKEWEEADK